MMPTTPLLFSPLSAHRWQAVIDRDTTQRGLFIYGVRTTGIYCQPGCASRQPKPQNIVFFQDCEEASNAGFRPCKRCTPDKGLEVSAISNAVISACRSIEMAETPPNLNTLAQSSGLSPAHFQRTFKQALGISPKDYAQAHQMERFRTALQTGGSVTDAVYSAGYSAPSRAHDAANQRMGMVPSTYRAGAAGEVIGYTQGSSYLGPVTVAITVRGIACISIGDKNPIHFLRSEFPKAELIEAPTSFREWATEVIALIEEPTGAFDLPLDIRGTAFQQRVWKALRDIPPGKTATYAEIAAALGSPQAQRAVGSACGRNRLAVIIPCHRALRSDGGLGGYRWGLEHKKKLLNREKGEKD
jgi:AraC family transcriptional regulator, regulatory protein of adaptative response / methylated-DNA-[protein]-cysteine methyltransferase